MYTYIFQTQLNIQIIYYLIMYNLRGGSNSHIAIHENNYKLIIFYDIIKYT